MDQTQPHEQETVTPNKPDLVLRDGALKATVWRNEGENGPYWTTTFAKTISGKDGNPRDVQNFSQTELLRIGELGRETYAVINDRKRAWSQEQSQSQSQAEAYERNQFKKSRRQANSPEQLKTQGF